MASALAMLAAPFAAKAAAAPRFVPPGWTIVYTPAPDLTDEEFAARFRDVLRNNIGGLADTQRNA